MSGDYARCGALNRQGEPCRNRAGKGTSHLGLGRCRNHGGASQVIHGQRARTQALRRHYAITSPELGELVAQYQSDPDPLNVLHEIAVLRALIHCAIEAIDESQTPQGQRSPERSIPDLIEHLSRVVSRVEKARARRSISEEELILLFRRVALVVKHHVRDQDILAAIARDWDSLRVTVSSTVKHDDTLQSPR